MLDDILFLEGERQEMILEMPTDTSNAPVDITYDLQMVYEIPLANTESVSIFV